MSDQICFSFESLTHKLMRNNKMTKNKLSYKDNINHSSQPDDGNMKSKLKTHICVKNHLIEKKIIERYVKR